MSIIDRENLKTRFQNGSRPDQTDFENLLDSFVSKSSLDSSESVENLTIVGNMTAETAIVGDIQIAQSATTKIPGGLIPIDDITIRKGLDGKLYADTLEGIPVGGVTTSKIADGAVTNPKIADGAVTQQKIDKNTSQFETIGSDILAIKLAGGLETTASGIGISDNSITTTKIQDSAITAPKIDKNTSQFETTGSNILAIKLAGGLETTASGIGISDNAIATSKIQDSAITSTKVVDGAITSSKVGAGVAKLSVASGAWAAGSVIGSIGTPPTYTSGGILSVALFRTGASTDIPIGTDCYIKFITASKNIFAVVFGEVQLLPSVTPPDTRRVTFTASLPQGETVTSIELGLSGITLGGDVINYQTTYTYA